MNKLLTLVIPTYRSENLVLSHLKNLHKKYKIIIIENSYDKSLKRKIENKYKNVNEDPPVSISQVFVVLY